MNTTRRPSPLGTLLMFAALAATWGASFLFIKIGLEGLTPAQVVLGRLTAGIPGRLAKSVPEHRAIYEAIVQRDGAAAEALMRRHILSVMADQLTSIAGTSITP